MCLNLESVWPSQSEPAALCSGGRRGSAGSAGCCHWSNCPHWLSVGRALSAANGRSPCSLKTGNSQRGYAAGRRDESGAAELTAADGGGIRAFRVQTKSRLHPPSVLLPSSSHTIQTHTCKTENRFSLSAAFTLSSSKVNTVVNSHSETHGISPTRRTLPHHPGLQTFAEATGLAGFPPPLGDLTLVHHRTAVLNVA